MSVDADQRPAKKRRFFVEQSPATERALGAECGFGDQGDSILESSSTITGADDSTYATPISLDHGTAPDAARERHDTPNESAHQEAGSFDAILFESVVGERLAPETTRRIREMAGDDMERAINIYFDGSWQDRRQTIGTRTNIPSVFDSPRVAGAAIENIPGPEEEANKADEVKETTPKRQSGGRDSLPDFRYIGAFGVEAWATRSGATLVRSGESIRIERQKIQPKPSLPRRAGKTKAGTLQTSRPLPVNKSADIVVRFANSRGDEVGRLSKDVAAWVSTLLDQKVCKFEGVCVLASDRIRVNDTIYLQLQCFLLRKAFDSEGFKLQENNRTTGLFEAKETDKEKNLRLRQVALVRLFDEINLQPTRTNERTEKHKRQGLLRAAEIGEQYTIPEETKRSRSFEGGGSSPPSEEAEEGKELEQDQLDTLYKKAQSFDFDTPAAEAADTFAMQLRHYQKQALHWMIGKEKNEKLENKEVSMHPLWEEYCWPTKDVNDQPVERVPGQDFFYVNPYSGELSLDFPVQEQNCLGGILADEMGLGKTIEMLSLIHSHKSDVAMDLIEPGPLSVNNLPRLPNSSATVERAPCTTLVVAPMSLLAQWQSEAENASNPGTLKSIVYYGNEKTANLQHLCCEANAASAPQLVITSYGVVLSEFSQVASSQGLRGSHGGLFSLEFFRVILDEAHHIKNRQSKTAKACYEISAQHRWVLTGTPIVNRLEDLFSLVRFLKVEPWSNFSYWKTFVTVPFESKDFVRALDVVQTVLEPLVLRRTKDMKTPNGEALVPLPPKTITIEEVELSKPEREVYDHIFTMAKRTFAVNVAAGTLLKSYTTIFAQILRLRQSCCHPVLVRNKNIVADEEDVAAAADAASGLADDMDLQELIERFTSEDGEQDANRFGAHVLKQIQEVYCNECPICSEEPMIDQTVTGCWHSACKNCLMNYIERQRDKGEQPRCFNCREPINERDVFEVIRHDDDDDLYTDGGGEHNHGPRVSLRRINSNSSAKITALITHLKRLRRDDASTKSVVFSQFTSFLDLIEPALSRDNIPFLRFDGSMPQKQRAAVLSEFAASRKRGVVLLLSLRAGGVGLNLTQAKRVFMMDPWWSFAVESQAIDRVHRMGQEDPVDVYRFIVRDSVEHRMLKIQERKKFIATSLGMMSGDEKKLQTIQDIKDLLS